MRLATGFIRAGFGICLALVAGTATAADPGEIEKTRIEKFEVRLFRARTGTLSEPLVGGPGDPRFQAAQAQPWDGILVDLVLRGPADVGDQITVVKLLAGNRPDAQSDGEVVAREFLEGFSFGPDGLVHVPVLIRGHFTGDVKIGAEIVGDPSSYTFVLLGFDPRQ